MSLFDYEYRGGGWGGQRFGGISYIEGVRTDIRTGRSYLS
jgi:hypothetical protein